MRLARTIGTAAVVFCLLATGALAATGERSSGTWLRGTAVVGYSSEAALQAALKRHPARIVRRIRALKTVELRPLSGSVAGLAAALAPLPGITSVERQVERASYVDPALTPSVTGAVTQWQYGAVRADAVPETVLRAAGSVTLAVVDTGADLSAPDLAAKAPVTYSVRTRTADVADPNGHGTFVAALAAGSVTNGEGVAGVGGDVRLMIVQAGGPNGSFTDVQEAAAIVYAVDHGARIVNLSLGGRDTSATERKAVDYAVSRGALLVAAVGNEYDEGNPVEYPAALLQPPGSHGLGGRGLAVAASTRDGTRASFSNTGSHLSLAAPGEDVFGALSAASSATRYPRVALAGSTAGLYGFASGTSFAAPQVSGAAALVWAANPSLSAQDVAQILEETASGRGTWTPELGYGVLDVGAAVARAQGTAQSNVQLIGTRAGRRVSLAWTATAAATAYSLTVVENGKSERVLIPQTTRTSASFSLAPGATYSFRVAALDAAGAPVSTSRPWTVSLVQVPAALSLTATKKRGRAPLKVEIVARLKASDAALTGRRVVVLQSYDGRGWQRAARATTADDGRVSWRFALGAGAYRVRARFAGADDLAPATSQPLTVSVR